MSEQLQIILPLLVMEFILKIIALVDLAKRDKRGVKGEKKYIWVIVILLFSTIGPVLYLVAGKKDYTWDEDDRNDSM
ncbi:hypothetical protein AC622_11835 [Bacillus sp. FJAT-27916]|uniref:PLD nuclease N-terminal domain-containing protein n=1 Tax=Bacillus sp. FJAT-27916 TaxID=1679169 RepID=UPI000670785F|nr:PLD nuclease N-terminal domain-containing protein [Bacillus sp. FJAT-27916]KMY44824.1 hypothetical protein AC622_11835 [Bacillus sp. FJAT-27916]